MPASRARRSACIAATIASLAAAGGCRHAAQDFMWVDAIPASMYASEASYQIAPGDVIGVRVWNHEANSLERARVREDGKISLPFLNDVEVAGWEPPDLARLLEAKLKAFIVTPAVTVVVHERRPLRVAVLGRVVNPGLYELERGAGVLQALAAAGGVTAFADEEGVYVLRSGYWADNPAPARIRFRYRDLRSGKMPAAVFALRVGDAVIVE